ncbi:alpha/beta fold hydrolase [Streptomyces sp. NPDC059153]|uniref:alpha/beta fold hydrolase n=1 Tax=Streptomyces sp. NPDC059153 TaxID=3346743 RepID=UPI0036C2332A
MSENNVGVVLAQGAWADGSSWNKVIAGLASEEVKAIAAPLPLTSLADDITALDRTLELVDGPVVLVGHAYAGAVIASTNADKVAALVYIAALAPEQGETVADVFYRAEPHPQAPRIVPDRHELIWLPEDAFADAFTQNASGQEQAQLAATQRPLAAAAIKVAVGRPAWKDRPSWFLVTEEDRLIPLDTQRFMARRMKARVRTAPVDHLPMLTAPGAVVDIVMEAVREVGSER